MKIDLKLKKNTRKKMIWKRFQIGWNWIGTRLNLNNQENSGCFFVVNHDEIQLLHNMMKLGKVIKGLLNYGR